MSSAHILTDGESSPQLQRQSFSSDHSEIPSYPQSESHASPSIAPAALPEDASSSRSLVARYPALRQNGKQLHSRPDTASTTASFASASAEPLSRPSIASTTSSRHTSPKKSAPSRIGRSFEALLASDETYVLKETAKVALDPEDSPGAREASASSPGLRKSSPGANRVVVERRRQRSASSASIQSHETDEQEPELTDATPRPPHAHTFQSPQQNAQASPLTGTLLESAHGHVKANGSRAPASPDRTTSLQRHVAASPSASSTASALQTASMSARPALLPPSGAERLHGTVRSRPRATSSIGLEHEIHASTSEERANDQAATMGSFRQRMKKTSGFLRKLRKDNTQVRRDKDATKPSGSSSSGPAYSIGSNPSASSLNRSGTSEVTIIGKSLSRRESKTSVLSQGGSSTHRSTTHSPHKQSVHFTSTDGVAVPSIPERFMRPSSSANSHATFAATEVEAPVPDSERINSDAQVLAPHSRAALRVPSAPATLTEASPASKLALPQRSSSQGHVRKKSLGSGDSTGAIRLAVQHLESQMDNALKEANVNQLVDQRAAPVPKQQWGPSPQLPDLDIQRYKERSGSFLEEPDLAPSNGFHLLSEEAPEIVRSFSAGSYPNTPATMDSHPDYIDKGREHVKPTGLGIDAGSPARGSFSSPRMRQSPSGGSTVPTSLGWSADEAHQVARKAKPLQEKGSFRRPNFPSPLNGAESPGECAHSNRSSQRNSIEPTADVHLPSRTADSGASLISIRSFETAAESAGFDSADPRISSLNMASHEQQRLRCASPRISYEHGSAPGLSLLDHNLQRGSVVPQADLKDTMVHDAQEQTREAGLYDVGEDQEQSIRVVTKRSNTEDVDVASPSLDGGTTTIITAPASPDMDSSSLPKMVELSEHSSLRPGRNGSISRGPPASTGSIKNGAAPLTPSLRRSPSLISSPTSARTSFDTASRPAGENLAASQAVAASAQELANKCWEEDSSFLKREKIAEWLGGLGLVNRAARTFYFAHFDFSGLRLDVAFRRLCDKLFLRAETQQIDRILSAFSQRYYECNPDSIFGSSDVIHSVVFSILLLNTDLHIAELQERMTRQQFVRNTLSAIAESSQDEQSTMVQDDSRSSFSVAHNDRTNSTDAFPQAVNNSQRRNSISSYLAGRNKQVSSASNFEASSDAILQESHRPGAATNGVKERDAEIEVALRDIYAAVKSERILLPSPEAGSGMLAAGRTSGTFSPILGGRRKGGKGSDRMTALKRGSIRGIQGLLGGISSNGSMLDPAISPNPSRSSVDSWGRPSQSFASGSEREKMLSPLPTLTPGFASTLTQTIIKESMEEDAADGTANHVATKGNTVDEEDDDDKLALAGPPWAKEGSLTRKHYWESTGKRAKDKSWTEVFVVVSRGTLSMFRFETGASVGTSSKARGRPSPASSAGLGGGDWLSSATCLGEIPLAHSLANALPPPGYNKTRPHVFALTLPGGKVFFFQTGHEELVNEWVSTCNYWAARQSKEPLAGGVSNMEYGWNKVLPQPKEEEDGEDGYEELDGSVHDRVEGAGGDSRSVTSGRSGAGRSRPSFASPATSIGTSSNVGFLTNERTFINEWRPPSLPTIPSTLAEERQLTRLEKQVSTIEAQLTLHNELRQPMLSLYSPKGTNYTKALANWERKSNHLLQELVKYQSYTEALRKSADLKAERRARREVEGMIEEGDAALAELEV